VCVLESSTAFPLFSRVAVSLGLQSFFEKEGVDNGLRMALSDCKGNPGRLHVQRGTARLAASSGCASLRMPHRTRDTMLQRPIVSLISDHGEYRSRCGYCSGDNTSVAHGMAAEVLSVETYQALLDRFVPSRPARWPPAPRPALD
jgi:hypothetical protein